MSEQDFDETHVVIIRNFVYREYLECFNSFVKTIGGVTEQMMAPILQFESDRRAFIITMNALGTDLSKEDRFKFYNTFGLLDENALVKLSKADDFEQIRQIACLYEVILEFYEILEILALCRYIFRNRLPKSKQEH